MIEDLYKQTLCNFNSAKNTKPRFVRISSKLKVVNLETIAASLTAKPSCALKWCQMNTTKQKSADILKAQVSVHTVSGVNISISKAIECTSKSLIHW